MKAKFDFARLNKVMSEFKKSLWNLESSERHFRDQRLKDQSKFFRLLAPGRSEERQDVNTKMKMGGFMSYINQNIQQEKKDIEAMNQQPGLHDPGNYEEQ